MLVLTKEVKGQCPEGTLGVTGAGCGCLASCDLTSFGGPNCGSGVSGNCTAGELPMSVDIVVPDGCTFTVTAVMQNRPGCTASGADAGDQLKVDIPGGPKPFQTGASNATLTDSYTLAGPATIRVSGTANRADEIITYSTTYSGVYCNACGSILPLGISDFEGIQKDRYIQLSWLTGSELNSDYFKIFRSVDGINYEDVVVVNALGNNSQSYKYDIIDTEVPMFGTIYYKLNAYDNDGQLTETKIIQVDYTPAFVLYEEGIIRINLGDDISADDVALVYDYAGKLICSIPLIDNVGEAIVNYNGLMFVSLPNRGLRCKIVGL